MCIGPKRARKCVSTCAAIQRRQSANSRRAARAFRQRRLRPPAPSPSITSAPSLHSPLSPASLLETTKPRALPPLPPKPLNGRRTRINRNHLPLELHPFDSLENMRASVVLLFAALALASVAPQTHAQGGIGGLVGGIIDEALDGRSFWSGGGRCQNRRPQPPRNLEARARNPTTVRLTWRARDNSCVDEYEITVSCWCLGAFFIFLCCFGARRARFERRSESPPQNKTNQNQKTQQTNSTTSRACPCRAPSAP